MKMKLVMDKDGNPEVHVQPCRLTDGRTKRFLSNPALQKGGPRLEDVVARANQWAYEKETKQNRASELEKEG